MMRWVPSRQASNKYEDFLGTDRAANPARFNRTFTMKQKILLWLGERIQRLGRIVQEWGE